MKNIKYSDDVVFDTFIAAMDTLANRAAYAYLYSIPECFWDDKFARQEINNTVNDIKKDKFFTCQEMWTKMINLPSERLITLGFRQFSEPDKSGYCIFCMPAWLLAIMPNDISFEGVDIFGSKCVINNKIDNDTRGGVLAYGLKIKK